MKMILGSMVLGGLMVLVMPSPEVEAASPVIKIRVITRKVTAQDGIASVLCRSNEKVTGGGCWCSGNVLNNQAGMLFACEPLGNGYGGACYPYEGGQVKIPIRVQAR